MRRGRAPFTIRSCDNLQANGTTARTVLLSFGEARSAVLRRWMETNFSFSNSMVDRITPRTTEAASLRLRKSLAFSIFHRSQNLSGNGFLKMPLWRKRPAWELVGAQMTADVVPYEKSKDALAERQPFRNRIPVCRPVFYEMRSLHLAKNRRLEQ